MRKKKTELEKLGDAMTKLAQVWDEYEKQESKLWKAVKKKQV